MSAQTVASPKQLAYLKSLAAQTGTTFTFPCDGRQASREIERLKALKARDGRCLEVPALEPDPAELPYATEQKPGETIGYGATASRTVPVPPDSLRPRPEAAREPLELGCYVTRSGERRALYGIRVDGKPRIIDAAADGQAGRIYTVESELAGGNSEVKGLVADYLARAEKLGRIPMAAARRRRGHTAPHA